MTVFVSCAAPPAWTTNPASLASIETASVLTSSAPNAWACSTIFVASSMPLIERVPG